MTSNPTLPRPRLSRWGKSVIAHAATALHGWLAIEPVAVRMAVAEGCVCVPNACWQRAIMPKPWRL